MMKAKPIEPGCLAMIVNAGVDGPSRAYLEGKFVKVIRFIGHTWAPRARKRGDYWEVEPLNFDLPLHSLPHAAEVNLMRIDDPGLQKEIEAEEWKKMTVHP